MKILIFLYLRFVVFFFTATITSFNTYSFGVYYGNGTIFDEYNDNMQYGIKDHKIYFHECFISGFSFWKKW